MVEKEKRESSSPDKLDILTQKTLEGISASEPLPDDKLVQQALEQVFSRYKRRRVLRHGGLFAAALAAAVLGLVTISSVYFTAQAPMSVPKKNPVQSATLLAGAADVDGAPAAKKLRLNVGSTVSTGQDTALVEFARQLKIGLGAKTHVLLNKLGNRSLTLTLEKGHVALSVPPDRQWSVSVFTKLGSISVKGTIFSVEYNGDTLRVDVLRGAVSVKGNGTFATPVNAGNSLKMPAFNELVLDAASAKQMLKLLDEPDIAQVAPAATLSARPVEHKLSTSPPAQTQAVKTVKAVDKKSPSSALPSPGDMIRLARTCRLSRNWTCAADHYRRVLELYPQSSEVSTALVLLAGAELNYFNDPAAALGHYRQYLDRNDTGALDVEAMYGVCRALQTLGRPDEERQALEEFISKHPNGVHASVLRKRLEKLKL